LAVLRVLFSWQHVSLQLDNPRQIDGFSTKTCHPTHLSQFDVTSGTGYDALAKASPHQGVDDHPTSTVL